MNQQQLEHQFLDFFRQFSAHFKPKPFAELGIASEVKSFDKGDLLIEQGTPATTLFFLSSGLLRYVSYSEEGKEFSKFFLGAPGLAGSTRSMLTKQPSYFSIEVLEPAICLCFNWDDFYLKMRYNEGFLEAYLGMLEGMFLIKEEREASFVLANAEQRYLNFIAKNPHLLGRVPLQYIASYIGITPVALSRIRRKLNIPST